MGESKQKQEQILKSSTVKKTIPRERLSNDPFTEEEIKKLLEAVTNARDHALLVLGFNSGMRVSEAVSVDRLALNEAEGFITIWDEKKNVFRKVYLPVGTINELIRFYDSTPKEERTNKFFNFGCKTAENIIQHWTATVLGKKKSWHCVRHSYVTLSSIKGTPIPVVCANTGDAAATILKHYTNLPPQVLRRYVEDNAIYKE